MESNIEATESVSSEENLSVDSYLISGEVGSEVSETSDDDVRTPVTIAAEEER